jgi:hypothetical protein
VSLQVVPELQELERGLVLVQRVQLAKVPEKCTEA